MIVHYVVQSTNLGHKYACGKFVMPDFYNPKGLPADTHLDSNKEYFTPDVNLTTCKECKVAIK